MFDADVNEIENILNEDMDGEAIFCRKNEFIINTSQGHS